MSQRSAKFVRSVMEPRGFIRDDLPQVAFAGRSNVGKSSLINSLLKRNELARTSKKPGRTRAINYYLIDERFYLVDLPGYGYAKASKSERDRWARVIDTYLRREAERGIHVVQLVDAKIDGSELDYDAALYFLDLGAKLTVAVTKIDRIAQGKRARCLKRVREFLELPEEVETLAVSAKTGDGMGKLWNAVLSPRA